MSASGNALLRTGTQVASPAALANEQAPEYATLKQFYSACYQASLLREEERSVTFRAILASPELFAADGIPPESLQRLAFCQSFPLDASELRRLSVAADTQRTLIGVRQHADGGLRIWGLVSSMISGRLPAARSVARALDLEGNIVADVGTENVGARHRSAYRLAGALPGVVVIVISQDGGVRFVAQKNDRVTCWEQE
jgi:hypothetical protein